MNLDAVQSCDRHKPPYVWLLPSKEQPLLVEWDFAPKVLRLFERGSTTEYCVAVPVYASSRPSPASRARTIAWARSIT